MSCKYIDFEAKYKYRLIRFRIEPSKNGWQKY